MSFEELTASEQQLEFQVLKEKLTEIIHIEKLSAHSRDFSRESADKESSLCFKGY